MTFLDFEKMTVEYVDPKELKPFEYSRKLFPELHGEAYEFLKEDIRENGIRTPLEVTRDKIILCGHERQRVALELGLKEVPVIFFTNAQVTRQKIRCIKDNLARKAVDTRTKVRCFGELAELYGLEEKEHLARYPRDAKGHVQKPMESGDAIGEFMTVEQIAKETNLPPTTAARALKIEKSDLPEPIKDAAFKGKLGIEPTANLLREPREIQKQVIPKILAELETDKEHILVQNIVDQVKGDDCEPSETVDRFLTNYAKALENFPADKSEKEKQEAVVTLFKQFLADKNLTCPICGENHLKWSCGHEF